MNPYLVMGVPRDADDPQIRRAYLEALKQVTPEADPERFQALTRAYDLIKDQTSRLNSTRPLIAIARAIRPCTLSSSICARPRAPDRFPTSTSRGTSAYVRRRPDCSPAA